MTTDGARGFLLRCSFFFLKNGISSSSITEITGDVDAAGNVGEVGEVGEMGEDSNWIVIKDLKAGMAP